MYVRLSDQSMEGGRGPLTLTLAITRACLLLWPLVHKQSPLLIPFLRASPQRSRLPPVFCSISSRIHIILLDWITIHRFLMAAAEFRITADEVNSLIHSYFTDSGIYHSCLLFAALTSQLDRHAPFSIRTIQRRPSLSFALRLAAHPKRRTY